MLNCDVYYPQSTGGFGSNHLAFCCCDIVQIGDVEMESDAMAESKTTEAGTPVIYTRNYQQNTQNIVFEGSKDKIRSIQNAVRNGAFALANILTAETKEHSNSLGRYCYINGQVSTKIINHNIDLMQITIPAIVMLGDVSVPESMPIANGENAFIFGTATAKISDCEYLGNGEYKLKSPLQIVTSGGAGIVVMCNINSLFTQSSFNHIVGYRANPTDAYTLVEFNLTDDVNQATLLTQFPVPDNQAEPIKVDCYIDLSPKGERYAKPFRVYFEVWRYGA